MVCVCVLDESGPEVPRTSTQSLTPSPFPTHIISLTYTKNTAYTTQSVTPLSVHRSTNKVTWRSNLSVLNQSGDVALIQYVVTHMTRGIEYRDVCGEARTIFGRRRRRRRHRRCRRRRFRHHHRRRRCHHHPLRHRHPLLFVVVVVVVVIITLFVTAILIFSSLLLSSSSSVL